MCLAVPMEVLSVDGDKAVVQSGGVEMTVSMTLVGDVPVGDFVIIHAGYALQSMSREEAMKSLAIFDKLFAQ